MRKRGGIPLCALGVALTLAPAAAHDLRGYALHPSVESHRRGGYSGYALTLTGYLWPSNYELSVCFFEPQNPVSAKVLQIVVHAWPLAALSKNLLRFGPSFKKPIACTSLPQSDIRISIVNGGGLWSDFGNEDARDTSPTMGLDMSDPKMVSPTHFSFVVSHEFGHALGLGHEVQSPSTLKRKPCEWNYDAVLKAGIYFGGTTREEKIAAIKEQVALIGTDGVTGLGPYRYTDYDPSSVMHDWFPSSVFRDGKDDTCFSPEENDRPSKTDYAAISADYGPGRLDTALRLI